MKYVTAGESHGPALTVIVSDVPAGLAISVDLIQVDLERRRSGYGRSSRQSLESDSVEFIGGIRHGRTIGSPVSMLIRNAEYDTRESDMPGFGDASICRIPHSIPRPGHADLAGVLKTGAEDCRDISERASARETAARVAAAGIAREFLAVLGVEIHSYVTSIGKAHMKEDDPLVAAPDYKPLDIETSEVRCPDPHASEAMCAQIDSAREAGESLGGTFRVVATGLLPGLGGYACPSDRLTARIGSALFSIPAIKGVEFGLGFQSAERRGSEALDGISVDKTQGFTRATNRAGGIEGGMTTGMPLIVSAAMKPLPSLSGDLGSVNLETLEPAVPCAIRSDICAVPAAAVVAESELAFVLASAYLEKFGRDSMDDIQSAIRVYKQRVRTMSR